MSNANRETTYIKMRLYSAIKWKIYNEHVTNIVWYSVLSNDSIPSLLIFVYNLLFFIAQFRYLSIKSPVYQEGCTTPRVPYCLLWKMTMIKTRPITIATALAPPNILYTMYTQKYQLYHHTIHQPFLIYIMRRA